MTEDRPPCLLAGKNVLIVEDQYLIADEMSRAVTALGGKVVGPCPTVESAIERLKSEAVEFALLDLNLRGEQVIPVADALSERDIPFAFATGYEDWVIAPEHRGRPRLEKPVSMESLRRTVNSMLNPA